jgi:hypothetical protein
MAKSAGAGQANERGGSSPFRRFLADIGGAVVRWAQGPVSYGEEVRIKGSGRPLAGRFMSDSPSAWPDAFHWWIDAVGSYLVYTRRQIRIGQAGVPGNDIAILGDLRSHHADLMIGSAGVVLVPKGETTVNGQGGESFLLHDGDRIRFRTVELTYRQPQAWSRTARLELTSRHRLATSMDGIILLGETAVIGPQTDAIIRTEWAKPLFVNWYQRRYWVRGEESLLVDGKPTGGCAPLEPNSRIEGSWGSFLWEPIQRR